MEIIPPNAGRDVEHPDLLFHYHDMESGGISILPSIINICKTPSQNQYLDNRTRNCCTIYGGDHARRNSTLENIDLSKDARDISIDLVLPQYPYVETGGRSMTAFLQMAKNNGLIHGYAIIPNNKISFFQALYNERGIYCGSNKIDFAQMKAKKIRKAIIGNGPGHIRSVCKLDEIFGDAEIHDSEGTNGRYGTGHFLIDIDDLVDSCYTKVIFLNKQESQNLQEITDNKMIKTAIEVGITNGNDLDSLITREQAAVMVVRAMIGQNLEFEEAKQKAIELGVFNGLRSGENCIREELMLMVASMVGVRQKDDNLSIMLLMDKGITGGTRRNENITRRDSIIMITRAYLTIKKATN